MLFVITKKLDQKEATTAYHFMIEWFNDNPNRRVCITDICKVRRNHIIEDILPHCKEGVKIGGL
jgi:hypothetical protein